MILHMGGLDSQVPNANRSLEYAHDGSHELILCEWLRNLT